MRVEHDLAVRALGLGFGVAAVVFALFYLAGPWFFLEGRRPFQLNFTAGAALGLSLGLTIDRILRIPAKAAVQAMALVAVPGMLTMAAVGSHFAVFFPHLESRRSTRSSGRSCSGSTALHWWDRSGRRGNA